MFDYLELYLNRLKVYSEVKPDLKTLKLLHRQHLYNIPFENLDIHSNRKIILNKEKLLPKILIEKRGGFCYELNECFFNLLKTIGFKVNRISAGVFGKDKKYSPDFDHMALIVYMNGDNFLADVGFGDSFLEPVKLELNSVQKDAKGYFRITRSKTNGYLILSRSSTGKKFTPQYKFSLQPRKLSDYKQMCIYNQSSPESHFTQKVICSIATKTGRISLSNLKLIITNNKSKSEKIITESEFHKYLKKQFNITLKGRLIFPN